MRYMIRVAKDSKAGVMPSEALTASMAGHHEQLAAAGILRDASGLQASPKNWRIQYQDERRTLIDGPFAETKELIAGHAIDGGEAEIEMRQLFEPEDSGPGKSIERFRELETTNKKQ